MMKRPLCLLCLLFLMIQGLFLSLTSGQSLVEVPASSIFQEESDQEVLVTGQVYDKNTTENTQILFLKNNSITYQNKSFYDFKLVIYDSSYNYIKIGQHVSLSGTIQHFEKAHNPGNFDQTIYYAKDDIYGSIFCEKILKIEGAGSRWKEFLYQLKLKWKNMLVDVLGEEQGNVLAAMLLGEKAGMDDQLKELYQKNGIGHILAISGLHISFIGLGIYQVIRKTGLPFWLSGVLACMTLSMYTLMIGFSVSVFRAYVMLLLKIGADMTGRIYDMMTALMLSAAITVWRQPLHLVDAGFYLSYGAVFGLIVLMPVMKETALGQKKWFVSFGPGLCVNVMLFPIQMYFYYEYPVYSILLNLLVVPLMSIVLTAGMVGSGLWLWSQTLGQICLRICKLILEIYEWISESGLQLPFARMVIGQPPIWKILLYYAVLVAIVLGVFKRTKVCSYLISMIILTVSLNRGAQITMLDVGQGDGIYVRSPSGITCFIDGGSSNVKEVGKYRIEPYLKSQGVGELDYVFISHGDLDHYSGILEMLERQTVGVRIHNLVLPANYNEDSNLKHLASKAKEMGTSIKVIKEGMSIVDADFSITCLQPDKGDRWNGNAGSMVLKISYGDFNMLCTGDVESDGEEALVKKVSGESFDVLKVAHHGSKYSTTEEFLKVVSVKIGLISAGKNNSYGHPHIETLERLETEGCNIYSTAEEGAITIHTDGKEMTLEGFH